MAAATRVLDRWLARSYRRAHERNHRWAAGAQETRELVLPFCLPAPEGVAGRPHGPELTKKLEFVR